MFFVSYLASHDPVFRANALIKRGVFRAQLNLLDTNLVFSDFDEAEKIFPNNPDVHMERGEVFCILNQFHIGLQEFKKALKLTSHNVDAKLRHYFAEYMLAKATNCLHFLPLLHKIKIATMEIPDCEKKFMLNIMILEDHQQYEEANAVYEKAIIMFPKTASLYFNYARFLLKWRGDEYAYLKLINKAIEIDDKCVLAYISLANFKIQRGCIGEVRELFKKAIFSCRLPTEMYPIYVRLHTATAEYAACKKLGINRSAVFDNTIL